MPLESTSTAPAEHVERILGSDLHYWTYDPAETAVHGGADPAVTTFGEPAGVPDRPPMVMVHGLRGTHHGLELLAAPLAAQRRIVIPDLPGFGDSGPMTRARHDTDGYGRAVLELLRRLDAEQRPVDLLGHSFGSLVAAHAACAAPELVRRLVLVNPISTPALQGPRAVLSKLTSLYYRLGRALPARAGRAVLSNRAIVLAVSRAMLRTRDPRLRRFVHDSHLRYFSRFHSPALLAETYDASVATTVADYAAALRMPTLLIAGETDEIAPLAGQRRLAGLLADPELVVLDDVGHLVHYETPRQAAGAIRSFVDAA